jgi:hypothetical protein
MVPGSWSKILGEKRKKNIKKNFRLRDKHSIGSFYEEMVYNGWSMERFHVVSSNTIWPTDTWPTDWSFYSLEEGRLSDILLGLLKDRLFDRQTGWQADWLADRLADRQTGRQTLANRLFVWQTDCLADRFAYRPTSQHTDVPTHRLANRQTGR